MTKKLLQSIVANKDLLRTEEDIQAYAAKNGLPFNEVFKVLENLEATESFPECVGCANIWQRNSGWDGAKCVKCNRFRKTEDFFAVETDEAIRDFCESIRKNKTNENVPFTFVCSTDNKGYVLRAPLYLTENAEAIITNIGKGRIK